MFEELKKRFNTTESVVSLVLGVAVVFVVGTVVFNAIRTKTTLPGQKTEEKKETGQVTEPISSPTTHTVVAGDTLWGISEMYYTTGYNWSDLAKSNNIANADRIEEGQTLTIPVVTPIFPLGEIGSGMTDQKPELQSYTVVSGDTLWDVAIVQYGNGYRWVDIAKANNLVNPDLIHAGNVLTLP